MLLSLSITLGHAQQNTPCEVTLGMNLGSVDRYYYDYSPGTSDENTILTNTLWLPAINIGATYKVTSRLSAGGIATFSQSNYVKTATYNNAILEDNRIQYLSIAPRIKYDWLTRKWITLYSSFALGLGFIIDNETVKGDRSTSPTGYVEATYIGAKVGGRLFGYVDLASSSSGFMRVGIGYNFNK